MRFVLMFKPDRQPDPGEHSCKQNLPEMAALVTELRATGVLQSAIGLLPSEAGARVRLSGTVLAERCNQLDTDLLDSGLAPADIWTAVELLTPLAQRCGDDLELFLGTLATGRARRRTALPFGPALLVGALIGVATTA